MFHGAAEETRGWVAEAKVACLGDEHPKFLALQVEGPHRTEKFVNAKSPRLLEPESYPHFCYLQIVVVTRRNHRVLQNN